MKYEILANAAKYKDMGLSKKETRDRLISDSISATSQDCWDIPSLYEIDKTVNKIFADTGPMATINIDRK